MHFLQSFSAIISLAVLASSAVVVRDVVARSEIETYLDPSTTPIVPERRAAVNPILPPPKPSPSPIFRPGRTLRIVMISDPNGGIWHFFAAEADTPITCDDYPWMARTVVIRPGSSDPKAAFDHKKLQWPGGNYNLGIDGVNYVYRNNGNGAGALFLQNKEIKCAEHPMKSVGDLTALPKCPMSERVFHPAVYCNL
jgi:hypothetical protein